MIELKTEVHLYTLKIVSMVHELSKYLFLIGLQESYF